MPKSEEPWPRLPEGASLPAWAPIAPEGWHGPGRAARLLRSETPGVGAEMRLLCELWTSLGPPRRDCQTEAQRVLALTSGQKGIWGLSVLRGKRKKYVPRFLLATPHLMAHLLEKKHLLQ